MPVIQFKGKTAIESYHHTVPHHTLEFDPKLSVLPKGEKPSLDGNLIIEGDNLLALKALLPTHAGRIKCIYIDPPYNTGNEGWVYNDNLTQPQFKEWIGKTVGKEGEDLTRHDKWCCMMYPRLQLLRELMRDDGVIFVSIDDNEVAHLRMLLDEIFGEVNFIANIIWEKKYSRTNDAEYLSDNHDHILLYAKFKTLWKPIGLARTEAQLKAFKNPDNHPLGRWQDVVYTCNKTKEERPNLFYPIKNPFTREKVWPLPNRVWGCGPEATAINEKEDRLWWGEHGEKKKPRLKLFLSEVEEGIVANTIWKRDEVGDNQEAERILREILPEHKFLGVKPPKLIKRMIKLSTGPEDLILDSFAGSGTTAQAVLEANREDGGNRAFVLVQQAYETKENEKERLNICRQITNERVRRLMLGYKYSGQKEEVLLEQKINLTVLKTAEQLLERIALVKQSKSPDFETITTELSAGTLRLVGRKHFKGTAPGVGGTLTHVKTGAALFGEYRDLGQVLPPYEELAKYIFYTETSLDFDKKFLNVKTGKIGEYRNTSYYLLYTPNNKEDQALDLAWLKSIEKSEKNRNLVVYCEKIWIHRDDLAKYQKETGRKVRSMLIPFNLK
jgi:adenine-specific DNA-methyltransferase